MTPTAAKEMRVMRKALFCCLVLALMTALSPRPLSMTSG